MSANGDRRRDRPGDQSSATTRSSGLTSLDIPLDDFKKFRPRSPDDPAAGDVHDPHRWSDPDPGLLERLLPSSLVGILGSITLLLIIAGLVAYLFPIFWPVITNPFIVAGVAILVYTTIVWLHGRSSGWEAFRRLTKSVVYLGDDLKARVGEQPEELPGDAAREYFIPFRSVRWGGFKVRPLLKRDLPYDPARMRGKDPSVDPDDPAVDRLNATTEVIETDTLGRVLVTHGSRLEYDPNAEVADRYVSLPNTVDQETVSNLQEMLMMLETELQQQQARLDLLLEANRELRDLKEAHKLPDMEQAVTMIDRIGHYVNTSRHSENGSSRQTLRDLRRAADGSGSLSGRRGGNS